MNTLLFVVIVVLLAVPGYANDRGGSYYRSYSKEYKQKTIRRDFPINNRAYRENARLRQREHQRAIHNGNTYRAKKAQRKRKYLGY